MLNLLVHFMKKNQTKPKQLTSPNEKPSVPLMISPQFSKRLKLGVGRSLPQFGLVVGFPCNAIFKEIQNKSRRGTTVLSPIHSKTNKQKIKTKKPINPNTRTLLIQQWAKTNKKKKKNHNPPCKLG